MVMWSWCPDMAVARSKAIKANQGDLKSTKEETMRKILFALILASAATIGGSSVASAQTSVAPVAKMSLKCVGAAEHKEAQVLRLQAAQAELRSVQARKAAAVTANNTAAIARIDARTARITARVAKIQANQATFAARCP
jgi:hypothetical protein